MTVRMELARILIRELNDYQIIELREVSVGKDESTGEETISQVENGRSFPIVIGLPEAQAIERRLKGQTPPRPQTHDLLMNICEELGGRLESIGINDLKDQTFFAQLTIRDKAGKVHTIDSRPSDAIALGIAKNVPIYVEERVLDGVERDEQT